MKQLLESWNIFRENLLSEIKMEQVMPRFESKAFLKAAEQRQERLRSQGEMSPALIDAQTPERVKDMILGIIPDDIQEKYKAEALNWVLTIFIKTASLKNVKLALETFYQIKEAKADKILDKKDIYSIGGFLELIEIVDNARPAWEEFKQSRADKDAEAGTNKIYEDDNWQVFIPENKGAACKLGKGTDWCTAAPGLGYYRQYHKPEDPLIIFISKKNPSEKYQFHYGTEQFMDKDDRQIFDNTELNKIRYQLHSIVAKSDKVPKNIREKAEEASMGYEPLPNGGYRLKKKHGSEFYFNKDGAYHREDGPAVTFVDDGELDMQKWYKNGVLDRLDGPAEIQYVLGSNKIPPEIEWYRWFKNGKEHREDGPAFENLSRGTRLWYLNGSSMPFYEWEDKVKEIQKSKSSYLEEIIRQEIQKVLEEAKTKTLTLYHRTSPESAEKIIKVDGWKSKEEGKVFFSTKKDGQTTGYGKAVIKIEIPEHLANLDDEFPDGEQHYWVKIKDLKKHTNPERIPGGLASELTGDMKQQHQEIADKHNVPVEQINKELKLGTKVELEHTKDPEMAHEIAMDHLMEDPLYYSKLAKANLEEARKLGKPSSETSLRDWFKRKGAPGKTGGWVDCNTCRDGKCKPCGRQEGEKRSKYPRCRPTPAQCKGYKRRGDNLQKEE